MYLFMHIPYTIKINHLQSGVSCQLDDYEQDNPVGIAPSADLMDVISGTQQSHPRLTLHAPFTFL